MEEVVDRMMRGTGARTQTELAAILGVGKAAISDAKRRGAAPPKWYNRLSQPPHNLNPSWIESGTGPMRITMNGQPETERVIEAAAPYGVSEDGGYRLAPLVKARPSGGGGSLESEEAIEGYYAFRRDWLEGKGRPADMRLMKVTGESMRPTLEDNDMVLVDLSQKDILDGKIFVIRVDDEIVVKRVGKRPGKLVLISDNREHYEPWDVAIGEQTNVEIVGRVIWLSREI